MQKTKKTMAGLLAATVLLGATSVLQAIQIEPVSAASDPVKIIAMGILSHMDISMATTVIESIFATTCSKTALPILIW